MLITASLFNFVRLIFQQRHLILSMARRELVSQYTGSLLGIVWTFINPLVMIFIYWVVFSVGFKLKPTQGAPFVVWLTAGMAVWLVFSEIVNGCASTIVANAHLIKKTVFPSQVLPVVKIVSAIVTHSVFLLVLMGLIVFERMPFSAYYFQFLYYLFSMSVLALGLGWIVSSLNVFIRDVGQVVSVVMQLGFWATPIFWDITIMPPGLQTLLKLNPMFYIVRGYRESFIYFSPFWKYPQDTLYFWTLTLFVFVVGAMIFRRLKPHFADVL